MRAITGGRMHIAERRPVEGAAAADVVLIHGASASLGDQLVALSARLAARYRVLAVDRPGQGWSDRPSVLATVVAGLARRGEIEHWTGGLLLGVALWIAFPFVLWTGAMIWENTSPKLAAIHAGDWLVKLLVIGIIVSVWR